MKQVKLDLTLDETNLILEGLGNMPFIKVHELIGKIHEQASAQVMPSSQAGGEKGNDTLEVIDGEK